MGFTRLETQNVYKNFDEKEVLKGVNFRVESGKAYGLLRRNGAGKTTVIRIIMGVFAADRGSVLLDGKPFDRRGVLIGYMPEERGLYQQTEITEQLVYLAKLRGLQSAAAKKSVSRWLEKLGMGKYAHRKLATLSKGNQQKIQLAATLMTEPDIIILDEPFSGLDPVNAEVLKDAVREMIDKGKIVLFSSHQMNYVEEFCDGVALLHHGVIAVSGGIAEIKRSYERNLVRVSTVNIKAMLDFCQAEFSNAEQNGGDVLITLRGGGDKAGCFAKITASGIDFDHMGVVEPTLNDIFVKHTKEELE
ncbi:MAG: ATP-binding cassette domain-containing protein [Clostridiales bacterium]|jgi:ABC-2 type transport system ATP-binding protein|nr:ATP-binding cassette domain-containing protein [Clostridiales bacterium]